MLFRAPQDILIRFARVEEIEAIQEVLHHPDVIAFLGGITFRDHIRDKIKDKRPSLWVAEVAGRIVGCHIVGGRSQSHYIKLGSVGVLPEFRRQRIQTSLYFAALAQGILEGRRLLEDTIVGDNSVQFKALPTMGFSLAGILKDKTASGKSIGLFQFSLIDPTSFETFSRRLPINVEIRLREDDYTKDLWEKNQLVYERHMKEFIPRMSKYRTFVRALCSVEWLGVSK